MLQNKLIVLIKGNIANCKIYDDICTHSND